MKAVFHPTDLSLDAILEELPFMKASYTDLNVLRQDVTDLFSFFTSNQQSMPFYTIKDANYDSLRDTFTDAYAMYVAAAQRLFQTPADIYSFFDCEMIREHGHNFIPYAEHTFNARGMIGQTLYGRFDAAVDPETERVTGIYEFNGDTPVMLCESINLQNRLTVSATGSSESQFNDWYFAVREMLKDQGLRPQRQYAVVCATEQVEDLATCETLSQVIGEVATCQLLDLDDLGFEHSAPSKPFQVSATGTSLDGVFILLPWEDMVMTFPEAFKTWRSWANNVAVLEPAWRWFISNKGMLAYVTHLLETDADFKTAWGHVPHLPTYLSPKRFIDAGKPYVAKPMLGRLSSNIQIFDEGGSLKHESDGLYPDGPRVYQQYCAPGRVEGRNNFILGMWMAAKANARLATAATLCIREFDAPVLDLQNERFIPHILVPAE
ncbi:glutathionylspermidine synthase family protein [Achromobacter denitrificans]